jgi:hypothetical protein
MKNRSICRRCHRLRVVDNTRCCPACDVELRAMERRRPSPKPNETTVPDLVTEEEREELMRIAASSSPSAGGAHALDILTAADDGVVPPPQSVEWFVKRFRTDRGPS